MESPRLGERARSKLIHLLSDDHPDPARWVGRLRSLGDLENAPVFASAVRFLFHLELDEPEAELLIERVLDHRGFLTASLRRDPGLRVAAMDYLSNVDKRYDNPKIVEMRAFEETERSARTDVLTGLANRRWFRETLEVEVRRSRRYRLPVTVVMLDLDEFKAVNDTYGHIFGDLVLARVGRVVRRAVREADLASRYGGEEFALVLPETGRVGGFAVAERIRRHVEASFLEELVEGREVRVTLSCGLATYPEDALHADDLLARSDEALYGAKHAGRNRVCVHHREKRSALRFPAKPGTAARLDGVARPEARALDLSTTGALLEVAAPLSVADPVAVHLEPGSLPGEGKGWTVSGTVVRVVRDPERPSALCVGVAFDRPLPDEQLTPRVTLARPAAAGAARGTRR
ncbi:MAG TPA: diguanylate cyclase [Candidatus Polarisedimenticolaceae bacterium]|nr:diguanylate cyclase [Candidatus Polarisedimenticolaceae bacterium]